MAGSVVSEDVRPERGGVGDVLFVLCLMQAAFLLLAGLGEVLMMGGNAAYLIAPVAKLILVVVLATKAVKGRRWAMVTLMVVQVITLVGFTIQNLIGLLPGLDYSVNLVGLASNVAMPIAVVYLCASLIDRSRRHRQVAAASTAYPPPAIAAAPAAYPAPVIGYPVPVDPYAPAEITS